MMNALLYMCVYPSFLEATFRQNRHTQDISRHHILDSNSLTYQSQQTNGKGQNICFAPMSMQTRIEIKQTYKAVLTNPKAAMLANLERKYVKASKKQKTNTAH